MFDRRRLTSLLAVTLAAVLCACSRIGSETGDGPRHELRVGVIDEPDSLNPLFSHTAIADDAAALMYAPLFRYDATGELVPELAAVVPAPANGDIRDGGRTITLRLRRGLRWSDGAPLDVRDLVFTWHAVMNARNAVKLRAGWDEIERIDTPDRQTAIVHLRAADATVLSLFAGGGDAAYPPLPAHLLTALPDINRAPINARPVSSGAWMLSRWNHGSDLQFVPNPLYWRGRPRLDRLALIVRADAQTLVTALRTHEIDLAFAVPLEVLGSLPPEAHLQALTHPVAAYRHLDFNCKDPILADSRVRAALNTAIDWPEILHAVYRNHGTLAVSDIYPDSWAAPDIPQYTVNPAAAGRALDQAGWLRNAQGVRMRDGRPLRLTLMSGNANPLSTRVETLIASSLARIGVGIEIKNAPASYLFAENGPLYRGTYQLAWMSDTRAPDPDNYSSWNSAAMPPAGANTVFLHDPVVDAASKQARLTADRGERRRLYQQEEARLHELVPSRIFAWQRETIISDGHVTGLRPATFYSSFYDSWEWQHDRNLHASSQP